jgi:hypothetical protein
MAESSPIHTPPRHSELTVPFQGMEAACRRATRSLVVTGALLETLSKEFEADARAGEGATR